jgi:hypothetical protein
MATIRLARAGRAIVAAAAATAVSCSDPAPAPSAGGSYASKLHRKIAADLSRGLPAACPEAPGDDERARAACADALVALPVLRDFMADPFLWGMQISPRSDSLDDGAAAPVGAAVFRKTYLSLFVFTGAPSVEAAGARTVVRVRARFRDALPLGTYPYPFWHSGGEFDSYRFTTELVFVLERGKIAGALRSASDLR